MFDWVCPGGGSSVAAGRARAQESENARFLFQNDGRARSAAFQRFAERPSGFFTAQIFFVHPAQRRFARSQAVICHLFRLVGRESPSSSQAASRGTRVARRRGPLPLMGVVRARRAAAARAVFCSWWRGQSAWTLPGSRKDPPSAISTRWSTSVAGDWQAGCWQVGCSWRVRVRREDQGAIAWGWVLSHRVCADMPRWVCSGHRARPDGVRRPHPGAVQRVGGMVGVMAPAYAHRQRTIKCGVVHAARPRDRGAGLAREV
nr:MAG TPA: hypothetical protein [Caudoviricetes sp.]